MKSTIDIPAITLNQATASGKNATNKQTLPLYDVPEPGDNDVLSGRGVTTNKHAGNVNFRSLVALNKELYVTSTKKQKMAISRSIVEAVRSMNPPGRFLDKNADTGLWNDIGDRKAIEKTSQALRDGAATLRKQLSEDLGDPDFLSAVFETDGAKSNPGRSDGSVSGGSTNGDAKKASKARPMKSKMAKKGHRRAKSVPMPAAEPKKMQPKRARLDQVVPHVPDSAGSMKEIAPAAPRPTHHRSASMGTVASNRKQHKRTASTGAAASVAHRPPEAKPHPQPAHSAYSPEPAPRQHHQYPLGDEELLDGLNTTDPWAVGHSRNSSTSSSGMMLPPFFPMSPIGRQQRQPQQQHIFSMFQEPRSSSARPPMSPMHRSWSPRDFHEDPHWRHSIGGATCFSEGDIDIPSLDRTFDRTFPHEDDRAFALEEDMHILPPQHEEEMNVAAQPMGDGSEKVASSRSGTPSERGGTMDDMDFQYSPTMTMEFGGNKNDLDDVIMKDSEDPSGERAISPLPFMRDGAEAALLDNLPDLLQMPIAPCGPFDGKASDAK